MNSPKDYLTDRVADTEKLLKGYFSFSGKSPVEVIFSGGVNDTIVVLPWSVFIKAIEAFLTESIQQSMEVGRQEGEKKMGGKVLNILEGGRNIPLDIKAPLLIKKAVMFISQRLLVIGTQND